MLTENGSAEHAKYSFLIKWLSLDMRKNCSIELLKDKNKLTII